MVISDVELRGSHNLGAAHVVSQVWSGIAVHAIRITPHPGYSWHQLACCQPVLSIVVNEIGGRCDARLSRGGSVAPRQSGRRYPVGHVSVIPADLPVWGYSEEIDQVDEVRLILDINHVEEILGEAFAPSQLQEPHLVFNDDSLLALARLLVGSADTSRWSTLFGDSLVAAMVSRLSDLNPRPTRPHRRLGLSARQMSDVTEYIAANLASPIRLGELANFAGLSLSQFGRAFKTSTGTTPHQWHLNARIETAKRMLENPYSDLAEIALDSGFSEQSHFNRAFRTVTGTSPGAWRRRLTVNRGPCVPIGVRIANPPARVSLK
jgi:AraC-like DNA-binding protein